MRNGLLDQETEKRLLAYFNGELDEEGRFAVEQWLNDSPENKKVYHQLEKDALFIRWANREQKVHVEDRKAMLFQQIRRARIRKIGFRVAASVAVLVALGGVYLFMSTPTKENMLAENTPIIRANYPQARLVLSTGEVIDLTKNTDNIVEKDGSVVAIDTNKALVYNQSGNVETEKPIYNKVIVPRGGEFFLTLSDGTGVWLNAESRLRYPVAFTGKERKVEMEGEVYFEVAKNKEKPFIVTVNGVDIRVLGTSFNVSAYQEEVVATLVEGKVQLKKGNEQVILSPNQQAIWSDDEFRVKQVDARNYVLWKEGIFYFEDVDLETILDDMARWYNVNVFYMNPALKEMKFSVEIRRYGDINEILRRIEQTKRVKFEIKDRTINVYE